MNPKVLSIFNNAKIFLSETELKELSLCIEKEFGKAETKPKRTKTQLDKRWTVEAVTERLLAKQFRKKPNTNNESN
ncbi:hypothetical protein [Flavobacterium sp.]|uniref:hypothetical protein n=1 Tax=Flavobacterium sp. TaxID=239 RepID=UPI0037532D7C